jgi:hypothetical protein
MSSSFLFNFLKTETNDMIQEVFIQEKVDNSKNETLAKDYCSQLAGCDGETAQNVETRRYPSD